MTEQTDIDEFVYDQKGPERSETVRLKHLAEINPTKSEISDLDPETEVSFVALKDFGTEGEIKKTETRQLQDVYSGYTYFREGDIAIAKITPSFENGKGAICRGLTNEIGFGTTELHILRPHEGVSTKFLWYVLQSKPFRDEAETAMRGVAGQQRIPTEFLENYKVNYPGIEKSQKIQEYISKEEDSINSSVQKLNVFLEKMDQYLNTFVTETMLRDSSKQIDPSTEPQEWLKPIPENWDIVKLKFLADIQTGVTKGSSYEAEERVSIPYLRVANVQDGHLDLSKLKYIEIPPSEVESYLLQEGDILMNEGGDFDKLGRGTVWTGEIDPCIHQNHVFAVQPHNRNHSRWISKLTECVPYKFYFKINAKQSTNLASISVTDIKEVPIVLPPENERQNILKRVNDVESRASRIRETTRSLISSLEEKRRAVITAAVTGQIDVSNGQDVI